MYNFIEDYLRNPALAVASAINQARSLLWSESIDEEVICQQISTPQFRLYEEMLDFSYLCTYDRYNDNDNGDGGSSDSSAGLSGRSPRLF